MQKELKDTWFDNQICVPVNEGYYLCEFAGHMSVYFYDNIGQTFQMYENGKWVSMMVDNWMPLPETIRNIKKEQ